MLIGHDRSRGRYCASCSDYVRAYKLGLVEIDEMTHLENGPAFQFMDYTLKGAGIIDRRHVNIGKMPEKFDSNDLVYSTVKKELDAVRSGGRIVPATDADDVEALNSMLKNYVMLQTNNLGKNRDGEFYLGKTRVLRDFDISNLKFVLFEDTDDEDSEDESDGPFYNITALQNIDLSINTLEIETYDGQDWQDVDEDFEDNYEISILRTAEEGDEFDVLGDSLFPKLKNVLNEKDFFSHFYVVSDPQSQTRHLLLKELTSLPFDPEFVADKEESANMALKRELEELRRRKDARLAARLDESRMVVPQFDGNELPFLQPSPVPNYYVSPFTLNLVQIAPEVRRLIVNDSIVTQPRPPEPGASLLSPARPRSATRKRGVTLPVFIAQGTQLLDQGGNEIGQMAQDTFVDVEYLSDLCKITMNDNGPIYVAFENVVPSVTRKSLQTLKRYLALKGIPYEFADGSPG